MNYTIATMQDIHGNQEIGLDKHGNQYMVWHNNKAWESFNRQNFNTLDEAERLFLALARCFIRGEWSAEDRLEIMQAWKGSQEESA